MSEATKELEQVSKSNTACPPGHVAADSATYWHEVLLHNLSIAHSLHAIDDGDAPDSDVESSATSISDEIMHAPRRKSARDALAQQIANALYPKASSPLAAIIQYEKDIVTLRTLVTEQRRSYIDEATQQNARRNWSKRILKQGPWTECDDPLSLTGAPALPMPVEVSSKESMEPFFAHLRNAGTHEPASAASHQNEEYEVGVEPYYKTELIEFEKGVLYSDGRLDLCKMVTGPRSIGQLMEALRCNPHSRHFLLGNNIIGPTGAADIANFIFDLPDRIETWYLAGNCIDGEGFKLLVDAMAESPPITNVWMKRNPLGSSAAKYAAKLIMGSGVRTLDLDQTELGDAGVAELFNILATHPKQVSLRNIYLNACGIGLAACNAIADFLASPHCRLESLYMSSNPIGDAGAAALANGLRANASLQRLSLQSTGLKDNGVIDILQALLAHKSLMTLDVGQAYATEDLGMRYNWLTDFATSAFADLVARSATLRYLNISRTPMTQRGLLTILSAATASSSLVWFTAKPLVQGEKDAASVKAGQEYAQLCKRTRERLHANVKEHYDGMSYKHFENAQKRFLVSPFDVRLIDSVYRNRDAGLARRGLKRLEKWWDQSNQETLDRVVAGEKFE